MFGWFKKRSIQEWDCGEMYFKPKAFSDGTQSIFSPNLIPTPLLDAQHKLNYIMMLQDDMNRADPHSHPDFICL